MIKAPSHITSIKPYVPGKPIEELERELGISGSVKLASNENPIAASPLALKALSKQTRTIHRYPDGNCHYLRDALSGRLTVGRDQLIFGNGSNELIELAVRTFLSPGDEAIMAHPSFVVYATIVQTGKGKVITVPLKDWKHDLNAMAAEINDKTRMIFIANPNNPTGTINTQEEMDAFMKQVPDDILVVIDEAYSEYVVAPDYPQSMHYLKQNRDILILRTFSKIYGLAGLRIGYGITGNWISAEMNKVRQPFNVNSLAQTAALAALSDKEHLEKSRRINERGKKFLYKELKKMGLHYIETEANFILIVFKNEISAKLYSALLSQGIIIRPVGPDALRVTIGRPRENKLFVEALKKAIISL